MYTALVVWLRIPRPESHARLALCDRDDGDLRPDAPWGYGHHVADIQAVEVERVDPSQVHEGAHELSAEVVGIGRGAEASSSLGELEQVVGAPWVVRVVGPTFIILLPV